ncbi:MAG: helix-turn-helix domain-containing protein, partial [Verrucomicrobiales bacterium]|nr:helix-turn-helix domain-containing protein [Verrucomicrobiales bacterium]
GVNVDIADDQIASPSVLNLENIRHFRHLAHRQALAVPTRQTHRALCNQIIRLLRAERERRGMSKYLLSAQSGLSQQTIGYIERGLRSPSLETALRLADGMGVPLEDIIKQARKRK